ncbi:peritrophin-44-like [Anneissia japonica]|uniref:peritrophin-44-like n=1 Tax=Anneissia japonica TaxID=1529436 RepID=UPI0014255267|nr:peritrophin-44-like [Anneissia japonica]
MFVDYTLRVIALVFLLNVLEVEPQNVDPFCYGKPGGFHADPNNCLMYYNCDDGIPRHYTCPANEAFDSNQLICTAAQYSACTGAVVAQTAAQFCTGKTAGFYPHPNFCDKFYQCNSDGTETVHLCYSGLGFNSATGSCDDTIAC